MSKQRDLSRDFDRLMAATSMFATQELERTVLGNDQDYDDAKDETHQVVADVLDIVERSLDEDLLERLDRGEYQRSMSGWGCWPRYRAWTSFWPYFYGYRPSVVGRRHAVGTVRTRTEDGDMLNQIIEDFRSDIEAKLKRARRDDRAITDQELDESLKDLKEDLKLITRREKRREERREESRNTETQHSTRKG